MSRTRVLIAASIYPPDPGGPAIHAKRQYEWLNEHGVKAEVVALAHYRRWPKIVRHLIYLSGLLVRVWKFDVVYAHDAVGAGIPGLIAAKIFRKKFVVRIGGDLPWERYAESGNSLSLKEWYGSRKHKINLLFILSRWLIERADLIIVTSPILLNIYKTYYGIGEERIKVIPNPIPEVPNTKTSTEPTIVYASRLVAYKNLEMVLRALSRIFPTYPDLEFVIMGDGPDRERLERLARELGTEKQVSFRGSVTQREVLEETARCLFAIAPALTEFNPNYILQAVGLGKPFLISSENGLPFHLNREFEFNPRNEVELESRIKMLLENPKSPKIDFKMSWEDNLRANLEAIRSLL